jgi:ABC-2 type transport system ATP-binding protein
MIEARGLTKRYGEHLALDGLDLAVAPGEVFALFGGNGAGKSTTVNIFLGFIPPSGGSATIAGHDVAGDGRAAIEAKRHLAYVAENVMLYGHASPRENLRYFASLGGMKLAPAEADAALAQVGLDAAAFERPVRLLSKGMRQKCGLAIAFAKRAPALFLDEPFSGLDPLAASELQAAIAGLKADGRAILMCTHDLFRARALADHVGIMRRGKLVRRFGRSELDGLDLERVYLETMAEA